MKTNYQKLVDSINKLTESIKEQSKTFEKTNNNLKNISKHFEQEKIANKDIKLRIN
jgi:ABC-type transporter Mla subunit MlaD